MSTNAKFRSLALAFAGAVEAPHFEKTSFQVKKKIFATLDEKNATGVVKLSAFEQEAFCGAGKGAVSAVKGYWGERGWTEVNLKKAAESLLKDILSASYVNVTAKKKSK